MVLHRSINSNSGTKQRCCWSQGIVVRYLEAVSVKMNRHNLAEKCYEIVAKKSSTSLVMNYITTRINWCKSVKIIQFIPFMDNNVTGVSSFCNCTIRINSIESVNWTLYAVNFKSLITILTISAWVDISSHSNMVANFEAMTIWTYLFYNTCNLMSGCKQSQTEQTDLEGEHEGYIIHHDTVRTHTQAPKDTSNLHVYFLTKSHQHNKLRSE